MKWHELVFSENPRMQLRRHAIFWLVWLFYFVGTFFYKQQPFIEGKLLVWLSLVLIKSILILAGHSLICYATIYFFLPRYLFKGKYFSFSFAILAAGAVVTAWTYLCYGWLFPLSNTIFHSAGVVTRDVLLWNSFFAGLLSSLKLVAVAIIIKLLKTWWLKQNENMKLEREKINVELQLLKAQIHPDFLFSSLDRICFYAQNDSAKASSILLKLSDLMSYMLYECNQPFVPLEKEIKMLRDYLDLEKKRLGDRLDVDIQVIVKTYDKMIAPLLLLPFIENSFLYCENKKLEKSWLNVDIRITDQDFSMKIINGRSASHEMCESAMPVGLQNVCKRLEILYKDCYELKITTDADFMISFLRIQLTAINQPKMDAVISPAPSNQQNLTTYATG